MTWPFDPRPAKSLVRLRSQIDTAYPDRDKSSDGLLGDAAHSSRASDHNPTPQGIVNAIDITHDPRHGVDSYLLAEQLLKAKDPRIKYIISNKKIASGSGQPHPAWVWRKYTGKNDHSLHVHVSVKDGVGDGEQPWLLDVAEVPPAVAPAMPVLRRGSTGSAVKVAQLALKVAADGYFGPLTERAVEQFQEASGLAVDGIVGPYTWRLLLKLAPAEAGGGWIEVTATVFGGVSDNEMSAYDGHLIGEEEICVALPDRFEGTRPQVEVRNAAGTVIVATIEDVGPWLVDDPFWNTPGKRPTAETCYQTRTPLPSGPNRGKVPTNPAGIDLSLALAKALGVDGKGLVAFRLLT